MGMVWLIGLVFFFPASTVGVPYVLFYRHETTPAAGHKRGVEDIRSFWVEPEHQP
jgi:hypothetical protein